MREEEDDCQTRNSISPLGSKGTSVKSHGLWLTCALQCGEPGRAFTRHTFKLKTKGLMQRTQVDKLMMMPFTFSCRNNNQHKPIIPSESRCLHTSLHTSHPDGGSLSNNRVTALFDREPHLGQELLAWAAGMAWADDGIQTAHALAWLLVTHWRLGSKAIGVWGRRRRAASLRRTLADLLASPDLLASLALQARLCWVFALPPDLVPLILEQCQGRHGWFY